MHQSASQPLLIYKNLKILYLRRRIVNVLWEEGENAGICFLSLIFKLSLTFCLISNDMIILPFAHMLIIL